MTEKKVILGSAILIVVIVFSVLSLWQISAPTALPQILVNNYNGNGMIQTILGSYTQQWNIQYDGDTGPRFTVQSNGPTSIASLLFSPLAAQQLPTYDPTRFWTVEVDVPMTYAGTLPCGGPTWWDEAIITGTATVLLQNLNVNGHSYGNLNLGTVDALGIAWEGCTTKEGTTNQLTLWLTNTLAAKEYAFKDGTPDNFLFDVQKALENNNLGFLASFTLTVAVTETVTTFQKVCRLGRDTGDCNLTQLDEKSGTAQLGVPWQPPAGLTSQSTTTYRVTPTQTFTCQGSSCTLQGTITQFITQVSSVYVFSPTTYNVGGTTYTISQLTSVTVVQTASTWTNTIHIVVSVATTQVIVTTKSEDFCSVTTDTSWQTVLRCGSFYGVPYILIIFLGIIAVIGIGIYVQRKGNE